MARKAEAPTRLAVNLAGVALDRAIIRTAWLGREQLAARASEHRSPLVLLCVDDYLCGARYPLDILRNVPFEGVALRQVAG